MAKKAKSVSREVTFKNVRLSYPNLFTKKAFDDDDSGRATFNATFLVNKKDKKNIKLAEDAIDEIIDDHWGKRPKKLSDDRIAWRDGDEEKPDTDGYEGCMFVAAKNPKRPPVVNRDKSPLSEDDGIIYAGCRVNAVVRFWSQEHTKWGLRINASLEAVQFLKKDEAFGAAPVDVDDKFEDESDDDDDTPARGRKKRSRNDDDDDDDKKSSKRRRSRDDDDEDEDDKTSRRSRRSRDDDDDDEDDSSSRHRRSRRDDD